MLHPASNCLHRTLVSVLTGKDSEEDLGDWTIIDYADPVQFAKIWDPGFIATRLVVIIWTDTAPDAELSPINASDCLSPIDWAVCYAARFADDVDALPEVCVLNLRPDKHASVPAVTRLDALKADLLPWLRVESGLNLAGTVKLLSELYPREPVRCTDGLKRILRDMRLDLTEPKSRDLFDRHAVANIIGPMILREQAARRTLHSAALLQVLKACGLVGGLADQSPPQEVDAEKGEGLDILLVDDQVAHGWADWVRDCLPGSTIKTMSDPGELVESVTRQMDARAESDPVDLRFRLSLPHLGRIATPILLLDLRLFSGRPAEEMRFHRDLLLPLIRRHFLDRPDLGWPSFSSTSRQFNDAIQAIENGTLITDTPEHREILTWLPRVLALADPSMPIVLFSSTDRKSIVSSFLPYQNIIVSFQKPPLSSLADPLVRITTLSRFREAMASASTIAAVRRKCQMIKSMADEVEYSTRGLPQGARQRLHIELYIDETLDPKNTDFAVGGVFGVFPASADADNFDDICVAHGLRYFKDALFEPGCQSPLYKDRDSGMRQLETAIDASTQTPDSIILGMGRIRLQRGRIPDNPLLQDNRDDGRLHKMLCSIVELFCAESLPAIAHQYSVPTDAISLSVFLGTRVYGCSDPGDITFLSYSEIHEMGDGTRMLRSMGGRDAFPILRNVLAEHAPLARLSIERAIAVSLPYVGEKKDRFDRVVHRKTRAVYAFDLGIDAECLPLQVPCEAFGIVVCRKVDKRGQFYLFVAVNGLDGQVFCAPPDCNTPISEITSGMFVRLEVVSGHSGFQGRSVSLVHKDNYINWCESREPVVSDRFLQGKPLSEYRPDYRALHYIADQALSYWGRPEFDALIPSDRGNGLAGQFDEILDQVTEHDVLASRSLDAGLTADALSLFGSSKSDRKLPSAQAYIAVRIWAELKTCKGDILCNAYPLRPVEVTLKKATVSNHPNPAQIATKRHSRDASPPPRTSSVAGTPAITTREEFVELCKKWRIRRYESVDLYRDAGEPWLGQKGFSVKLTGQNRPGKGIKVVVFANIDILGVDLPVDFRAPESPNMFVDGNPGGRPYKSSSAPRGSEEPEA